MAPTVPILRPPGTPRSSSVTANDEGVHPTGGRRYVSGMQITMDAQDPARQAQFWAAALGYIIQPPPPGYEDWPSYLRTLGVAEDDMNAAAAIVDPNGVLPRILIQRVPEPKTVKNRVHLDLTSGGGPSVPIEEQRERVAAAVERLTRLGATYVLTAEELGVVWAVLTDLEGNEFCA
jgi:hypothetical protein